MTLTKNGINPVSLWQNGENTDNMFFTQLAIYAGLLQQPSNSIIASGSFTGLDTGTVENIFVGFQPDTIFWYINSPGSTPYPEEVFAITADLVAGDTTVYGSPGVEISFGEDYAPDPGWDIRSAQFITFVGVNPVGINFLHTATGKYLDTVFYWLALGYS